MQSVAIFWDYENCPAPSNASGYALVNSIRAMAQTYGVVKSLRAYTAITEQFSTAKSAALRSELQCSGVSLVDCPHNGRKDVADKMMIVDMLAHAIDNPPSSSVIILISGDRDFAYAISILRLRCYSVVLCAPNNVHASLLAQASESIDWASIVVLPGSCMSFSKQSNEEQQRSISQGLIPSTPRSRGNMDYNIPLNDVGVIANPNQRHAVKHSSSSSSDAPGNLVDLGRLSQDYTQKTSTRFTIRRNSFNSGHLSTQDNQITVIDSPGYTLHNVHIIPDVAEEQEGDSARTSYFAETPDTMFATGIPLVDNAGAIVRDVPMPDGHHAAPETNSLEAQSSSDSSMAQMTYQLPVTTPLVVNQSQPIAPSPIQTGSAELSSSLPDATETTSNTATPTAQEVFVPPEISSSIDEKLSGLRSPFLTSSESGGTESESSSSSAYVTAASKSAPVSLVSQSAPVTPEPTRMIPPPQFKALVRVLQQNRSRGVLKPTRSQVALQVGEPSNGNPYRQAGVAKWAQYAELARKEGIIELGGREAAAWVALTPKWCDAHAT